MTRQAVGWHRTDAATRVFLALAGAVAAGLTLLATSWHGVGLSPDSAYYISAAESLVRDNGLVSFDGTPLVSWPPLLSLVLALPLSLGISAATGGLVLNAFAFGVTVYFAGRLFVRSLDLRLLAMLATLSLAVSLPLLAVAVMAWTEALFALLAILFVTILVRFLRRPGLWALAGTCLLGALLPLQRYVGGAFIPAGILLILTSTARRGFARRLKYAAIFGAASVIPTVAWIIRNRHVAGSLTGDRALALEHLGGNIREFYGVVADLVLPQNLVFWFAWLLVLLAGIAVTILLLHPRTGEAGSDVKSGRVLITRTVVVCLLFYIAAVVVILTPQAYDQLGRLVAPVYGFLVLLSLAAAGRIAARLDRRPGRHPAKWCLFAVFALWLILPVSRTVTAFQDWSHNGVGVYDTADWRRSPLIAWLRDNRLSGTVHSNDPAAVYLLTGQPARMSPRREEDPARVDVRPGDHLVWFRRVRRPYLLAVQELAQRWPLREVVFVGDGGVLVFEPSAAPDH